MLPVSMKKDKEGKEKVKFLVFMEKISSKNRAAELTKNLTKSLTKN